MLGGAVALVALVGVVVNRSPRLPAAAQDAEKADSFADWLLLVTGSVLVFFGLIGVGAGGLFILVGLVCLAVGGALILVARRGRADRRWRRSHARMFMGPPARRSRWYE